MDEIKPVAWMCNAHVFFMEGNAKDYALDVEMPVFAVYDQQAIDTLREEVERLRGSLADSDAEIEFTYARAERAEAEAEALRADAERYRALREALLDDESEAWEAFTQQPEPKSAADFDAAIDAVRKGAE